MLTASSIPPDSGKDLLKFYMEYGDVWVIKKRRVFGKFHNVIVKKESNGQNK